MASQNVLTKVKPKKAAVGNIDTVSEKAVPAATSHAPWITRTETAILKVGNVVLIRVISPLPLHSGLF